MTTNKNFQHALNVSAFPLNYHIGESIGAIAYLKQRAKTQTDPRNIRDCKDAILRIKSILLYAKHDATKRAQTINAALSVIL